MCEDGFWVVSSEGGEGYVLILWNFCIEVYGGLLVLISLASILYFGCS